MAFSQYLKFINGPLCKSGRRGNMVAKKSHVINVLSKPFLFPPLPMLVQIHYIHSAKRFSNWNKRALRNKELKCLLFPPSPNKPSRSMSSLSCCIMQQSNFGVSSKNWILNFQTSKCVNWIFLIIIKFVLTLGSGIQRE